ncbi:MAG: purine-binding chemotaxis protein CheW [Thermoanaerobacteraceae bacterium]|nr:purine-binding chemotaxis protein CheW [Thermoanaerobacteraceae bacterium]
MQGLWCVQGQAGKRSAGPKVISRGNFLDGGRNFLPGVKPLKKRNTVPPPCWGQGGVLAVGEEQQVVIFQLNDQQYALPIQETQEIIRMTDITRVPNTKPYVEGIINLRGSIVPVINLNLRLELPVRECTDATRIIVTEYAGQKVGMIVDNVVEVGRYTPDQVEPPVVAGDNTEYLRGVIKKDDHLWLLLNLERVL